MILRLSASLLVLIYPRFPRTSSFCNYLNKRAFLENSIQVDWLKETPHVLSPDVKLVFIFAFLIGKVVSGESNETARNNIALYSNTWYK